MTPFDTLLDQIKVLHATHPEVMGFAPFPTDLTATPVTPHDVPASRFLRGAETLDAGDYVDLHQAILAAGALAHWRETYVETAIDPIFLDQFGCYAIIGPNAPWTSRQALSFMVHMPPGLHYPWHHHPAEEIYMVVAGQADFHVKGEPSRTLGPGETSFHGTNTPHAMTTTNQPVTAYVAWRGDMSRPPVWTDPV